MNDSQIRQIVREELAKSQQLSRFNLNVNPRVSHTGVDSAPINSSDLKPGLKTSGSVTMAETKDYKFNVNFAPSLVQFYGVAVETADSNWHAFIFGQAALGQNLYFQPINTSTVGVGGKFEIVQSCSTFSFDTAGGRPYTNVDEGHLIDVERTTTGTIFARATVSSYGQNFFVITVDTLADNWEIIGNFFVS